MYEEVSRAPNHFSVVLFLRRCKSTAEKKAKQSLSHNSPEKPTILGKIGHFLGKSKKKKETRVKSKEKEKIIPLFPPKIPHFFPTLGKILGILGKNANKSKFTPHALKGQKLLAQGTRPG